MRILPGVISLMLLAGGCQSATGPVSATQAPAPAPATLIGTSWIAEVIDGQGVLDRAPSTMTLEADQRLSGRAACNRYFGTYELGDGTLRLKPAGSTRMACEPAIMEQEARFLAALAAVTAFRREGNTLWLSDASGRMRLRLVPLAPVTSLRAHAFDCAGGPSIVLVPATGPGQGETIDLLLPGGPRRLPRVPTASGARYADGGVSVWSKDREALLELDGTTYTCAENRRRSISEDARRRGVELRAVGQEPGWIFELSPDRMVFAGSYGTKSVMTPRPAAGASPRAGETVYAAVTEAHRLTVRIRETSCLDTMSGERYGSTVEVELDGKIYRGCGEALD
jgi:heat shock protein HslJ/uncharacterized membrane protein